VPGKGEDQDHRQAGRGDERERPGRLQLRQGARAGLWHQALDLPAQDIHIHLPEGAVPKDGPSAGIGMVTSIVSTLTGIAGAPDVAMTGEVTLRGRVLAIGGLKEKLLAALRGGIKTVLIPEENARTWPRSPPT
jgi:ATP-dependent Lon protease